MRQTAKKNSRYYKAFNSFKNLNEHPPPSPKYQQVNRKDVMQNAILLKNLLKKPKNYLCQTFDRQTAF